MFSENFVWVALAVAAYGNYFYLRDTLKGETKPNRVTFFLWGAAPLISFFAQKEGGGGIQILYTLIIALMPLIILAASFYDKKAYWKLTKFDVGCGILSLIALGILISTDQTLLALVFSVIADLFAGMPTIIKSYKYPDTETVSAYALEIVSSIIVVLTIHDWSFVNYSFAVYILFMNILFTSLLVFSPKRKEPIFH
ncbi:hypothetical protein KDA00_00930 [Candidatus Saccharibacteria bacterium]|nr:hypothetical protein [Candidatus Saccharibacteria bacterium]